MFFCFVEILFSRYNDTIHSMKFGEDYFKELKRRSKQSRVYKKYQLIGLEIAKALHDEKHKSLYMKMAKEGNAQKLLWLAKNIADRNNIQNKGAYFMTLSKELKVKLQKKF
ncbi:MAG: hypothetical protein A2945_03275 [Candidatus Liptonbacteria bacterium RIFCSPLOWO2_01_FULL_52_25]|uniref:Uncharacterized protein n=1 Tax=Candidatus Liptonbacteria bacterium RIFCSPLOWO2_01_FULL_52_25 TaxID=1798650 RepID=A0A1G2CEK6_9BACT|nr:MAG: hypothetical protein A2945_03275 [Candidatus Liptonbacteria bacterium RIFCSPLOWO2_01_FULL_52_25]